MSKMSEIHSELEHAQEVCRKAGILVGDPPETPDEKLDRLYEDFALLASRILALTDSGARLPRRMKDWMLPMTTARIIRAARDAEGSVRCP